MSSLISNVNIPLLVAAIYENLRLYLMCGVKGTYSNML